MIIDMKLNGRLCPVLFDTGAGMSFVSEELRMSLGLKEAGVKSIVDSNGARSELPKCLIDSIQTPDGAITFRDVSLLHSELPEAFGCLDIRGVIGSDMMSGMVVEIDSRARTLTIMTGEVPAKASLRRVIPFAGEGFMPFLPLQVAGGHSITVLFDTGAAGLISLKDTDFKMLSSAGGVSDVIEGYGKSAVGMHGIMQECDLQKALLRDIRLGSVYIPQALVSVGTPPATLLGMQWTEFGKVTIDYPRRRFFLEPFEKECAVAAEYREVDLTTDEGKLVIAAVWGGMRGIVEVGDVVVRINGRKVRKYDFCESLISGIPELKRKGSSTLVVKTKSGLKKITYKKITIT